MSKKLQLQVPVPCHEDWEKMTSAEKGRYCSSCQKTVIDFSNMSDREIALFFKKPSTGSVCGRFMVDQLDREMDIPRKRIPWVKYFFHFLLPGFLLSMKATAQGKVKVVQKETRVFVENFKNTKHHQNTTYTEPEEPIVVGVVAPVSIEPISVPVDNFSIIDGKVVDENDTPIPFASVIIKGTQTGALADSNGIFSINADGAWDSVRLVASSVGFLTSEARITKAHEPTTLVLKLTAMSMGVVVVTRSVSTMKKGMVMAVTKKSVIDKAPVNIADHPLKVYPNPAEIGSTLHIQWNKKEHGDYSLQLFSQTGQLVFKKAIYIDQEARVLSIDLPSYSAGNYFLTITNNETKKSYSEKIIIQ